MTIHAAIFDQNQVLLEYDHAAAAAYFADLLPISYEALGLFWDVWIDRVRLPANDEEERLFWRDFWQALCDQHHISGAARRQLLDFSYHTILKPYTDARPALAAAKEAGLKVGVLSNFSFASLHDALTSVGLGDLVDVALSSAVSGAAKPKPAAYRAILARLAVAPEVCLYFDNKPANVAAARQLGFHAYLVDRQQAGHDLAQASICDLTAVNLIIQRHAAPDFPAKEVTLSV